MADELDRLFERLVEALRERRGPDLLAPFTVRELYQELVPYPRVRNPVGFDDHAGYELSLLRLLAGERRYLSSDTEDLPETCARELAAPVPNRGIYRHFDDVRVRVNPRAARASTGTPNTAAS